MIRRRRPLRAMVMALATLLTSALLTATPARAQGEEHLGSFKAWQAWAIGAGKGRQCFAYATPEKSEGDYSRRGDTYLMISHNPIARNFDVVNVVAGYTYKAGSDVELDIDGRKVSLFTRDDGAWARDAATDAQLVERMRKGSKLVVRGTSSRGTLTTDRYSLIGFTAAHAAASKACGL